MIIRMLFFHSTPRSFLFFICLFSFQKEHVGIAFQNESSLG